MVSDFPDLGSTSSTYAGSDFHRTGCHPDGSGGRGGGKGQTSCAVRYGLLGYVGEFRYAKGILSCCGAKVVVQTNRGIEIGQQLSLTCSGCDQSIDHRQMVAFGRASGTEALQLRAGRILRQATQQDLHEEEKINADAAGKLVRARDLANQKSLEMKFVACEHVFGGERIVFHFMSESRIDFRDLVRDLAHEYHTRIEMHQVGSRDEARLVADYEICGRECCCKNFLKKLRPVSMRMAKLQKATLDPSKVSGRCGRLRCCLRYEHEGYEELNKQLPRVNTRVRTERGIATIRDRQVLTQLLTLIYDDNDYVESVHLDDVLETGLPKKAPGPPPPPPARGSGARRNAGDRRSDARSSDRRADDAAPPSGDAPSGSEPKRSRRRRSGRGKARGEGTTQPRAEAGSAQGATGAEGADRPDGEAPPRKNDKRDEAQTQDNGATPPTGDQASASPSDTGSAPRAKRRRRRGKRGRRDGPAGGEGGSPPSSTEGSNKPKTDRKPPAGGDASPPAGGGDGAG